MRRWITVLAGNALLVLLLLGLLEGAARVLADPAPRPLFDVPGLWVRGRSFVQPHPVRGFALRPGFEDPLYRINAAGFRGPELPEPLRPGSVILAVGDSTTFGWNVRDDETWPHGLQRYLAASGLEQRVLVVNAGVPSYTSSQVRLYLEELLPRLEPDVVLVGVLWNDVWFSSLDPWFPEALIHRQPAAWRRLLHAHSALFRRLATAGSLSGRIDVFNERAIALYADNLDAMARACAEAGAALAYVAPPFDLSHFEERGTPLGQVHFSREFTLTLGREYTNAMIDVASRHGAPVIDHRVSISRPRQPRLFQDGIHPRPLGNRMIAEDVGRSLVKSGSLAPRP